MSRKSLEGEAGKEEGTLFSRIEVIRGDEDVAALDPFGDVDPEEEIARLQEQDPGYLEQLMEQAS